MQKKRKKLSFVRGINPLPLLSECVPGIVRRPLRDGFKQFEIAEIDKVRGGGGDGVWALLLVAHPSSRGAHWSLLRTSSPMCG